MNCVVGRHGFIGRALEERLGSVASFPTSDTRVVFYLGGHTHQVFERNPVFEMKQVLDDYTQLLPYCYEHGIRFIYASSALVYEADTQFSRFKKTLESLAGCYETISIGM